MLDRVSSWLCSERAAALLGYVVGAVIGVSAGEGAMGFREWIWAGIAVLGVIQLRLFASDFMLDEAEAAEEA